jgi:lysophospholipase L1-like esterase
MPYLTDTFNRGTTSAGGAGTTTGVGNGWIDRVGNTWSLSSNVLVATNANYLTNWLVRPTSENSVYQRAVWTFAALGTNYTPLVLLRVNSSADNAYAAYIDNTGTLHIASLINGVNTALASASFTYSSSASYIVDFTASGSSGTNLTAVVYNATAPTTALATATVTGDTTSGLQTALTYGVASANGFPGSQSAVLYNTAGTPSLSISPTSAGINDGAVQALTPTLTNSSASLAASVSGGGTISTAAPTSGTAFNYTAPATGSGTATVTVTDATDSLTATASIAYAPSGTSSVSCSPSSFPLGVATPFTLTGTNTIWTSSTKPTVAGGTGAYVSNMLQSGQTLLGTLYPGSAAGTLTMGDSTDTATIGVTATANAVNNIVWSGDSLTYGQNGNNPGTTSATRLAVVLNGLGPSWSGTNTGVAGQTLTQMTAQLGSQINALYNSSAQNNYLVVQGGHNDIGSAGPYLTAAQVIANIKTYLTTAFAAHTWKIIWCTEPPAAYPGAYPYNFDQIRDAVNAYMRANWQFLGITALSDFASSQIMGQDGQEYNATYYSNSDFTHPTNAGYTIWGQYDLAAIQNSFTAAPRRLVQGTRNSATGRYLVNN